MRGDILARSVGSAGGNVFLEGNRQWREIGVHGYGN